MNKRFLYLSLSFFLISLGVMLLSFSAYMPAKAAVTQSIGEGWVITKYRNVELISSYGQTATISIGPAVWTVGGGIKDSNNVPLAVYNETYTGDIWRELLPDISGYFPSCTHPSPGTSCVINLFNDDWAGDHAINQNLQAIVGMWQEIELRTSSLYGFVLYNKSAGSPEDRLHSTGVSYPSRWTITGTLEIL